MFKITANVMKRLRLRPSFTLEKILDKACDGGRLLKDEIRFLLGLNKEEEIDLLFKTARYLRRCHFDNNVFLYGFLYFSTFCRNNCHFCQFRNSNITLTRYRKKPSEIVEAACKMGDSGVHLIDLTMGEDPEFFHRGVDGFEKLVELVKSVKKITGLPIMVSPGVIPNRVLGRFAECKADWYACYQETHGRTLFMRLRPGQSFDERMNKKHVAKKFGMLIEEGILSGAGESLDDVVNSILVMRNLGADQVRVMNFVPQKGTPMENHIPPDTYRELIVISVLRIVFPDKLIPASLDVNGLAGLKRRLDAGANLITSLVPPGAGLAGVANCSLDIEDGRRTPDSVMSVLKSCGLKAGRLEDYVAWINKRRLEIDGHWREEKIAC